MDEIKQTKLRNIRIEIKTNLKFEQIKKEKPEQCCFKRRYIDGFIIGACRSVYNNNTPKELPKGSNELIDTIELPNLTDKDKLKLILQIIGYKYSLEEAEGNQENIDKCHEILINLSKCILYAEKLFKREWDSTSPSNFKKITESKHPDSKIVEDFNLTEFSKLLEDISNF